MNGESLPQLPEMHGPCEVRDLFRAVGHPLLSTSTSSPLWRREVTVATDGPIDVTSLPRLGDVRVVDGVQRRRVLTMRQGRPVYLELVGAAAVDPESRTEADIEERAYLCGSHFDGAYMRELPGNFAVVELDAESAQAVVQEAAAALDRFRRELEADVTVRAAARGVVVVDGSIRHLVGLPGGSAVGVVKSLDTQYLADETEIADLKPGQRTSLFTIRSQTRRELTVHSCYVRLHTVPHDWWAVGVVRLEATTEDLLDPAAAWAYAARQRPGGDDPRWHVHLAPVRAVEEVLRARMAWAP